jgi:hypothetical protein
MAGLFFYRRKSANEFEVATLTMGPTTITALAAIFGLRLNFKRTSMV